MSKTLNPNRGSGLRAAVLRRKDAVWHVFFTGVLLCVWSAPPVFSQAAAASPARRLSSRLTQSEAVNIALRFCDRIGQPVSGTANVEFPYAELFHWHGPRNSYWLPRWMIRVGGAEIAVADETGDVTSYTYRAEFHRRPSGSPSGPLIARNVAIERASQVLKATGQPLDGVTLDYTMSYCILANSPDDEWETTWVRVFQGIQYNDQTFRVILKGDTGVVLAVCTTFPTPPPARNVRNLGAYHAVNAAILRLGDGGLQEGALTTVEPRIVLPNSGWMLDRREHRPAEPRVVWMVLFKQLDARYEVWVDTEDGSILGGEMVRGAGRSWSSLSPVESMKTAKEARLYVRGKDLQWSKKPVAVLNASSHPELLQSLRRATAPDPVQLLIVPRLRLDLVTDGKPPVEFYYVPEQEALGTPGEWHTAPADLAAWLLKLDPGVPVEKSTPVAAAEYKK